MSHQLKSTLYFATLILALVSYYNMDQAEQSQLAENTTEQVSTVETLK